jgi:hypothetical protein
MGKFRAEQSTAEQRCFMRQFALIACHRITSSNSTLTQLKIPRDPCLLSVNASDKACMFQQLKSSLVEQASRRYCRLRFYLRPGYDERRTKIFHPFTRE